ncbi:uncharacterized protein LOC122068097 [Macadamia integrifolia]|uniref:uncharacterized protein LOC122068097 n=1 Tax=Macadamia integrifolia TaxID=60698 RepID=UPI001C4FF264|nr:uncharacterized protein LOC122068097 [Macadamia integrifolia]
MVQTKAIQVCLAGIGGICRDHNKRFICCFSAGVGRNHAITAEVLAIRQALITARSMNFYNLVIESDNLTAINLLWGKTQSKPWRISNLLADCLQLARFFNEVSFQHNFREANAVADLLASDAATSQSPLMLRLSPSTCLSCHLYDNCTGSVFLR